MPTYGTFVDQELTFHLEPRITSEFEFRNILTETSSGEEQRICRRVEYLSKISFDAITFETCRDDQALEDLIAFFKDTAIGELNSFLFKNPLDYKGTANLTSHGDLTESRILAFPVSSTEFQLMKQYIFGSLSGYKTIHHVVPGSLNVYENGILTTDYTLTGGLITFNTAPTGSITAECEFLLVYRFNTPKLEQRRVSTTKVDVLNLGLQEIAQTALSPLNNINFDNTTQVFYLGFDPTFTQELTLENFTDSLDNRRELRQRRFLDNKDRISLDGNKIYLSEKDNLLCAFNACKGNLLEFRYGDDIVRFEDPTLTLQTVLNGYGDSAK